MLSRMIVSGASGFLGSHILSKAMDIPNISFVAVSSQPIFHPGVQAVSTEAFLAGTFPCSPEDVFINCLFPTNADGDKMADGLQKLFGMIDVARECGVGAFVNVSSQSVYASRRAQPAREDTLLCLETPYAVGKYCSEAYVNRVFADLPHTNIRMASLLGVGYDLRIVNRMLDQALRGEILKVVGGMQRYGFLDVRDAADGLVTLALSNATTWQETYNLGRRESYTLVDVAECIIATLKEHAVANAAYTLSEGEDTRNSSLDPSRFMREFAWRPRYTLSDTVATILDSKIQKQVGK